MTRALFIPAIATGIISLAACHRVEPQAPPARTGQATVVTPARAEPVPGAVRAVVLTARPGLVISGAERTVRAGGLYYDVEGRMADGAAVKLDLLETPSGWKVVEIQRDLPWNKAPVRVRAAAGRARPGFTPARVVEGVQAGDGSIIYDLFADGHPAAPALEVRVQRGQTEVLRADWLQ